MNAFAVETQGNFAQSPGENTEHILPGTEGIW